LLLGGFFGVGLVAAVLCVSHLAQTDSSPSVLCSEGDLKAAAKMQGWSDVEKFRLHLKALQPASSSLCSPSSVLRTHTTKLAAVASDSKASTKAAGGVGDGILSFLESAVFGGTASVSATGPLHRTNRAP